jgi:hypothetical protein
MPNKKSRINRTVSEDLAEAKEQFDELLEAVAKWEDRQWDEETQFSLPHRIQRLLSLVPRNVLNAALKFCREEEQRRFMQRPEKKQSEAQQ